MLFYYLGSSLNTATKTLWGHGARLSGLVSKYQLVFVCLFVLHAILSHQCLCPLFWHQCPFQKVSKMIDSGGNYTSTLFAHWKCYKNDFNYLWNSENLILFCVLFNLDLKLLLSVCSLVLIRRIVTCHRKQLTVMTYSEKPQTHHLSFTPLYFSTEIVTVSHTVIMLFLIQT